MSSLENSEENEPFLVIINMVIVTKYCIHLQAEVVAFYHVHRINLGTENKNKLILFYAALINTIY